MNLQCRRRDHGLWNRICRMARTVALFMQGQPGTVALFTSSL
ncbi:hypothetical protein HMPREF1155_1204 [Slackia sp. CM382]|nr:hypothetical protein HMPREF1155_1204 [Slackia sp. CM382]